MNVKFAFAIILIATYAHGTRAAAQNVYKCGQSYSQQPCVGGAVVPTDDTRSAAQQAQAGAAAKRDAIAADAMEKARLKQEAQAAPAYIPPPRPDTQAEEKKLVMSKPKKPAVFTAVVPAKPGDKAPKKKKKPKKKQPV